MPRVRPHHPGLVGLGQAVAHAADSPASGITPRHARDRHPAPGAATGSSAAGSSTACSSTPARSPRSTRCWRRSATATSRARSCSRTSTSTTPARPARCVRRWPDAAGLRARARRAAHGRPRAARGERRAALRRGGGPARAVGRGRAGARGERDASCAAARPCSGDYRVEYTPGPRVAPRRLPARADRHGVRRRRRRRADPARRATCSRRRRRPTSTSRPGTRSLDLVAGWEPTALALTHFGRVDDVGPHLDAMRERLHELAALVARARLRGVRGRHARADRRSSAGDLAPQVRAGRRRPSTSTSACAATSTSARDQRRSVAHRRTVTDASPRCRLPWARCRRPSSSRGRWGPTAAWAVTGGSSSATTTTTRSTTWRTRSRATSPACPSTRATRSPT